MTHLPIDLTVDRVQEFLGTLTALCREELYRWPPDFDNPDDSVAAVLLYMFLTGKTGEDGRAWLRESDEWKIKHAPKPPAPPVIRPARLHREGLQLFTADGQPWFGLGVTAFPLLRHEVEGRATVDAFLDWMVLSGVTIARAAGAYWCNTVEPSSQGIGQFNPLGYGDSERTFNAVIRLAAKMAERGLRLKLSVNCDMGQGPLADIRPRWLFERYAEACAGLDNVMIDGGNEFEKNDFQPADLSRPANVLCSRGSALGGNLPPVDPWDEFDFHGSRNDDWPKSAKDSYEIQTGNTTDGIALRVAACQEEPIGIGESDERGRTTANADDVFDFVAAPFSSMIVLHIRSGIELQVPGPNAQRCVDAAVEAARLVPAEWREGSYTRTGLGDSPLEDCPIVNDRPVNWLRVYGRIRGNQAIMVALRPTADAQYVARGGWRIVRREGARANIVYLER